ncbi:MAG: Ig-like domain-containing protein [Gemmatimonadota bacterium]
MRMKAFRYVALITALAGSTAMAQRPINLEIGAFGQFTKQDTELNIDDGVTIGGRLALFLIKNLALEGDVQYGKADWNNNGTITSLTLTPWAFRLVYGIPVNSRTRFLVGAGYQSNVYDGRIIEGTNFVARNEQEDAFTALLGLKICMGEKWNIRGDVVGDKNPSPNFTGDETLDGDATNIGFRLGLGRMLRGDCPGAPTVWALSVTPATSRHRVGEIEQLQVVARDGRGAPIALTRLRNYACTSDNPNVATVDANARVSAVAPGTATINCGGMYAGSLQSGTHTITVRRPEWRLTVTGGGTTMVGQTLNVSATAADEDNRPVTGNLTWTSSNPAVATVDNSGVVRCVSAGTATITGSMTRADETRTGTTTVTCTAPPPPPPPPAQMIVSLGDVHFGFNQHTLTRAGRDTLDWVIGQLTSAAGQGVSISVEGHTDPYGSDAYNDALSRRRSQTVYDYLTRSNGGIPASRIGGQAAFGERCLRLDDDHTRPQRSRADHAVNRRVELWDLRGNAVPTSCRPASDYQNR